MGQVEPAEEFGEWDFRVGLGAASRLTFSSRDNHCRIFIKNLLLLEDAADRAHDEEHEFTALCTTSGLAFREPMRSDDFRGKNVFRHRKTRILPLRCGSSDASPEVVRRPRSRSLDILIIGAYSKFAQNYFLALGVCFPQPCSSAGRRFAASRSRLQNYRRIVSFPQQKF